MQSVWPIPDFQGDLRDRSRTTGVAVADGSSGGAGGGGALRGFAIVVALIVGGPTLFVWAMWAIIGLYVLGLAVEVVQFIVTHAVAVGLSLLGAVAFLGGLLWRPRATITVASVLLYGLMAIRLLGGGI